MRHLPRVFLCTIAQRVQVPYICSCEQTFSCFGCYVSLTWIQRGAASKVIWLDGLGQVLELGMMHFYMQTHVQVHMLMNSGVRSFRSIGAQQLQEATPQHDTHLPSLEIIGGGGGMPCWCSAGNEGLTPINHPPWLPFRETPGSFPHSLLIAAR